MNPNFHIHNLQAEYEIYDEKKNPQDKIKLHFIKIHLTHGLFPFFLKHIAHS